MAGNVIFNCARRMLVYLELIAIASAIGRREPLVESGDDLQEALQMSEADEAPAQGVRSAKAFSPGACPWDGVVR